MLTHVMVGTNDFAKANAFYEASLGALGIAGQNMGDRAFFSDGEGPAFGVGSPADGNPASSANGGTIGFRAQDAAAVDAFHAAGLSHGGSDAGAPGVRENSPGKMYGAYLRDPDGNKICAFAPNPND